MSTVLTVVTGASGFVGRTLCSELLRCGHSVRGVSRHIDVRRALIEGVEPLAVGTINAFTEWKDALVGCDVVVHLAARVHVMDDKARDPLSEFREVNADGTLHLARQAAKAGAKRFVFISTVKVLGEGRDAVYRDTDAPMPEDAYALSKWEAEQGLQRMAQETGLEVVILRPPLVYGPGVKANLLSMMRWLQRGVPLPLGAVEHNRRSLVALDNLVDLIVTCLYHPAAANQTFLVSDGEDLSTTDLLRRLAAAMNVPARLLPVPVWALEAGAAMVGKRAMMQRLCGNLQVDISKTRALLGWNPPIGVDEGLRRAAGGIKG